MELQLTIRKNDEDRILKVETRTISYGILKEVIRVFDIQNLISELPKVLVSIGKYKKENNVDNLNEDELVELVPVLKIVTDVCIENMDGVNNILIKLFSKYNLTEEDIDYADFDEVIKCMITLITNSTQVLGKLIKKNQK